ncbi:MAG TPA: hypothetical protein PLS51_14130, partial [Flavobacterium sp.]|nr:hypothetical protein [Flavobacterium sp.]
LVVRPMKSFPLLWMAFLLLALLILLDFLFAIFICFYFNCKYEEFNDRICTTWFVGSGGLYDQRGQ